MTSGNKTPLPCRAFRLGIIDYEKALVLQNRLAEARSKEEIPDTLLLLQHPPVVTMGKSGKAQNVLSPQALESKNIKVIFTDRGRRRYLSRPRAARSISHSEPSGVSSKRSRVCLEPGRDDDPPPGLVRYCRRSDGEAPRGLGGTGENRRLGRSSLPLDQQTWAGPECVHRPRSIRSDQPLRDRPPSTSMAALLGRRLSDGGSRRKR